MASIDALYLVLWVVVELLYGQYWCIYLVLWVVVELLYGQY